MKWNIQWFGSIRARPNLGISFGRGGRRCGLTFRPTRPRPKLVFFPRLRRSVFKKCSTLINIAFNCSKINSKLFFLPRVCKKKAAVQKLRLRFFKLFFLPEIFEKCDCFTAKRSPDPNRDQNRIPLCFLFGRFTTTQFATKIICRRQRFKFENL